MRRTISLPLAEEELLPRFNEPIIRCGEDFFVRHLWSGSNADNVPVLLLSPRPEFFRMPFLALHLNGDAESFRRMSPSINLIAVVLSRPTRERDHPVREPSVFQVLCAHTEEPLF